MLKKIPAAQLRTGMHLQALCGSWSQHPFWRTQFLVKDDDVVRQILDSGITEVWIDLSKGQDVEVQAVVETVLETPAAAEPAAPAAVLPAQPVAPAVATATAPVRPASPRPAPVARVPIQQEVSRAAKLCHRSRTAMRSMFNEARLGKAVDANQCVPLVEEITGSVARNPGALVSLARLKTHDDYSYMHSVAVCALMVSLARQLGLDDAQTHVAGMAGLLHDLGKAAMPLEILNKPGKLTDAEFKLMRQHPERGYDMLREVGTAGAVAMDVVLHHHERMDGKGYPHGLVGDQISLMARMGAVCDIYDAVTSNRPYKEAWDPGEAVARMASWAPAHLDPVVFQNFVKALGIYPIGSLVKLQSGRLAVVVEQNPKALTSPAVRVFFSTKSNLHITPEIIDLAAPHCADRIVGRESNKTWRFQKLEQLWAGAEALQSMGR
jgi:putative nucleotidyltransferase with HDIG domain